tara:strand:+ start:64 stop:675 length:612 start_codon:yes stop_codon:yes gene_type:complete
MHILTKVTFGLGGALFLISIIALVMGGTEIESAFEEDPRGVGDDFWTGDTSSGFNGELKWDATYYVFVEEGYEVDVDVSGFGYFTSCEEWGDCELYDVFTGYDYIGDIGVDESGQCEVDFTETQGQIIDVIITEEDIPVGGILGLGAGCCGLCGALLIVIIGGVFALTLKDRPKAHTSIQINEEGADVNEGPGSSEYNQDYSA